MVARLTEAQALLRVAFLVAHADGRQNKEELASISGMLIGNLQDVDARGIATLALEAVRDVAQSPPEEVLPRIRDGIPTRAGRIKALHIACRVAVADGRLAWNETEKLVQLISALQLPQDDVAPVLQQYWRPA